MSNDRKWRRKKINKHQHRKNLKDNRKKNKR